MSKKVSKMRVLVYDSGVGGLTVLRELLARCPNLDYIYFADYQNMPLGNKSIQFLQNQIVKTVSFLVKKFGTGIVVLGCNTATSVAIKLLRKKMKDIIFVGTEPAINVAIKLGHSPILLLATPNTIKYNHLVRNMRYKLGERLLVSPEVSLASLVEKNLRSLNKLREYLEYKRRGLGVVKPECVVLGCTHYVLLADLISNVFSVPCVDGNSGVANRLYSITEQGESKGKISFFTNDNSRIDNIKYAWQILLLGR